MSDDGGRAGGERTRTDIVHGTPGLTVNIFPCDEDEAVVQLVASSLLRRGDHGFHHPSHYCCEIPKNRFWKTFPCLSIGN